MQPVYEIVARQGQDGQDAMGGWRRVPQPLGRIPVQPEHLYRPGRGRTLCEQLVDETWERFGSYHGRLSDSACPTCRVAMSDGPPSR